MLLYSGKALLGYSRWIKSRTFFIEAQLLETACGRKSRTLFIEAQLPATVIGQDRNPS